MQACQGLPAFWLGGLLVAVFSVGLGWLPPGGIVSFDLPAFGDPAYGLALQAHPGAVLGDLLAHLALPALTLALAGAGHAAAAAAQPRAAGAARAPRTRRACGWAWGGDACCGAPHGPPCRLSPAPWPPTSDPGRALVLVEYLFGWPGLGLLAYHAARAGDWALLQALALLAGLASIGAGLVADLLAAWADPRLRGHRDAP